MLYILWMKAGGGKYLNRLWNNLGGGGGGGGANVPRAEQPITRSSLDNWQGTMVSKALLNIITVINHWVEKFRKQWQTYLVEISNAKVSIEWELNGYPRCNIIYSFSLSHKLLSGLGSLLRMFCFLCVTSAVSSKLYYTRDQPNWRGINKGLAVCSVVLLFMYHFQCSWKVFYDFKQLYVLYPFRNSMRTTCDEGLSKTFMLAP